MKPWQKGLIINNQIFHYKDLLTFSSEKIVSLDTHPWEKEVYRFIINWLSDADHLIQYSSGTTGKTKEIRLSKLSMVSSAENTCRHFNLSPGQTTLLCMPINFIAGKMMLVRSIACDLNLQLTEPKSIPDISSFQSIDFCAMVPLQVINLLTCQSDLYPIQKLIIGGSEISPELEKLVLDIPTRVFATYGMAETSSHVAIRQLNGTGMQKEYHSLPGIELTSDERGCLVIQADYLPNPVVTNDLVSFSGPGIFSWIGRYDNLINSGGIKIVPEEVEAMIMAKTMLSCTVIGMPDSKLGHKLVFVFESDQAPDSFLSLKSDFENLLPRHWRPKEIIKVDKVPRNDAWKVDRIKLADMLSLKYSS